jgi:tetratricopeptide (TPR) repeat protein
MAAWGWVRPAEARIESRRAAEESLRIDSKCADSHVAWATHLLRFERDWKGAVGAANQAVDLNPSCGLAYSTKANCALAQSHFDEALRFFERAVHLDPLSYRTNGALGIVHWLAGRYDEAERWFRVAQNLKEDALLTRFFRSRLYLSMGRYDKAIESSAGLNRQSYLLLGASGAAYALAGNREKAEDTVRLLQQQASLQYVDPMAIAAVQAALNDVEGALDSLEQAVRAYSPMAAFTNIDPLLQPLRAHSRYQQILSALNLG